MKFLHITPLALLFFSSSAFALKDVVPDRIKIHTPDKVYEYVGKAVEKKGIARGATAAAISATKSAMGKSILGTFAAAGLTYYNSSGDPSDYPVDVASAAGYIGGSLYCLSFGVGAIPCAIAGSAASYFAGQAVKLAQGSDLTWTFGNGMNQPIQYKAPAQLPSEMQGSYDDPAPFVANQIVYRTSLKRNDGSYVDVHSSDPRYLRDIAYSNANSDLSNQYTGVQDTSYNFRGMSSESNTNYSGKYNYILHFDLLNSKENRVIYENIRAPIIVPSPAPISCTQGISLSYPNGYKVCTVKGNFSDPIAGTTPTFNNSAAIKASSSTVSGSVTSAINAVPDSELNKKVNPKIIANLANDAWEKASQRTDFQGVPYDSANPITETDVQSLYDADPTAAPDVGDLLAPVDPASKFNPAGTGTGTGTNPDTGTGTNPGTGTGTGTGTNGEVKVNVNVEVDFGPNPNTPPPTLDEPPKAADIIGPLFKFVEPFKDIELAEGGECTEFVISLWGNDYSTAMCPFLEQQRPHIEMIMIFVIYAMVILIILSA